MTRGMILGRFLPPHLGHLYLAEFARGVVDRLTIVVASLPAEPIPGELRARWMRELVPDARVVLLDEGLPPDPGADPDGWARWRAALCRVLPDPPGLVFGTGDGGGRLARALGAEFVPVDRAPSVAPASGAMIRRDPVRHWDCLPPCVRPRFVRRVCVFGPESTGKSTLARRLAGHFGTVAVPEYARTLVEARGDLDAEDVGRIARSQVAAEAALARLARGGLLICDTDVLATTIWADVLYGSCPGWVRRAAEGRSYDLYLLLDVDVPWVADPARCLPAGRSRFHALCRRALESRGRPFVAIRGTWDERFAAAVAAIERVLAAPPRRLPLRPDPERLVGPP